MNDVSPERFSVVTNTSGNPITIYLAKKIHDFIKAEHYERYYFALQYIQNKKTLDIACGTGYGSELLAKNGASMVTGADIDHDTIKNNLISSSLNNLHFITLNGENINLPESSFDTIISFETIEHIKKPEKFIEGIIKVLDINGTFVISTPNRNISNPGTSIHDKPKNHFHIREYDPDEFLKLLNSYFQYVDLFGQGEYPKSCNKLLKYLYRIKKLFMIFSKNSLKKIVAVKAQRNNYEPTYIIAVCRNKK